MKFPCFSYRRLLLPHSREKPDPAATLASKSLAFKKRLVGERRLHLGCGTNVLAGWANVDLSGKPPVVEWDLAHPLPCSPASLDFIYSEHFIEHISLAEARNLMRNCHRALCDGGILRLSTPSLEVLLKEYGSGRLSEWSDVGWIAQSSCQLLNEGMRNWGHKFLYDRSELTALLHSAGFGSIVAVPWRESAHPQLRGLECRPFHNELIVEALK